MAKCKGGRGHRWREERPKREIITTELVAGADFFHHLPCEAGRQRLEDWGRVRVKPTPTTPDNQTQHTRVGQFELEAVNKQHVGVELPKNIFTLTPGAVARCSVQL